MEEQEREPIPFKKFIEIIDKLTDEIGYLYRRCDRLEQENDDLKQVIVNLREGRYNE